MRARTAHAHARRHHHHHQRARARTRAQLRREGRVDWFELRAGNEVVLYWRFLKAPPNSPAHTLFSIAKLTPHPNPPTPRRRRRRVPPFPLYSTGASSR